MRLDRVDFKILWALMKNSRATGKELARLAGVSPPTAHARMRKMVRMGLIRRFSLDIDEGLLGQQLKAFVSLKLMPGSQQSAAKSFASLDEVNEVITTTGRDDVLVKVSAQSIEALEAFLNEKLASIKEVQSVHSDIVFEEFSGPLSALPVPSASQLSCEGCASPVGGRVYFKILDGGVRLFCSQACSEKPLVRR